MAAMDSSQKRARSVSALSLKIFSGSLSPQQGQNSSFVGKGQKRSRNGKYVVFYFYIRYDGAVRNIESV